VTSSDAADAHRARDRDPALAGRTAACALLLALGTAPAAARAEEPLPSDAVLDADGPPSLPGLSHRGLRGAFELMLASAEPTDVTSYQPIETERAYAWAVRWMAEAPVEGRSWYLGLSHEIAGAWVPPGTTPGSGGSRLLLGNPELWARGLWSSELGLSAGGGLALVLPVPRTYSAIESEVVRAVRVIRPWDYSNYLDLNLTARPFLDIRHVAGPLTLQVRQGLDVSFRLREPGQAEQIYELSALLSAYAGLRAASWLVVGLEFQELYDLTGNLASPTCPSPCDEERAMMVLSPSLKFHLPGLSPAVSILFPLVTPLRSEVASFFAARVHLELPLAWERESRESASAAP
jgi:hypothetical protein